MDKEELEINPSIEALRLKLYQLQAEKDEDTVDAAISVLEGVIDGFEKAIARKIIRKSVTEREKNS